MKLTVLLATGAFCRVAAGASAKPVSAPHFVSLHMDKSRGSTFASSNKGAKPFAYLAKRDDKQYAEIRLDNQKTFYSVNLTLGTPPQQVLVLVDTGSSDLWVQSADVSCGPNNNEYDGEELDCREYGVFDTGASSSWSKNESSSFYIAYADTAYASGYWGMDTLTIADQSADGLTFAVANASNSSMGVLGIGLPGLEATNTRRYGYKTYDNLPLILKRNGVIAKNAYSLFTNEVDADHGSILFGAVDHSRYSGQLLTLPITPTFPGRNPSAGAIDLSITLSGITFNGRGGDSTVTASRLPAVLDSGTTFVFFPRRLAEELARRVGAVWNTRSQVYVARCRDGDRGESFTFDFGGAKIVSPVKDYFVKTNNAGICVIGVGPSDGDGIILGDIFLSSAYVVYDLEEKEISIAQASFSKKDEEIEVIRSSVPRASRAPGYDDIWTGSRPVSLDAESAGRDNSSASDSPSKNGGKAVTPLMSVVLAVSGLLSVFI